MAASFAPEMLAAAFAIATGAGAVRGITGFGGALVMTPPLALLFGPAVAVPVALLLESVVAAPMLVHTRREMRWRVIVPILATACATVPLGAHVLVSADPDTLRRSIAAIVIAFSLLLLRGWRYQGRQRISTSIGLGALSGAMAGATSIGGPPVILYLLSGPDRVEITRANLTLFVAVTSLAAIVALWIAGALPVATVLTGLLLAPGYYAGLIAGGRLFPRFNDTRFRQFTLVLLVVVSAGILVV
ncbi:MAG: sulfite exporter TauE/SafE family protein [Betaproteobacteria bacterium]|nr:MAG: sulfite exporter TauE/SafE family protein [Betaproteobacteria bacterium]